jgi:hypothetical protein
MACFQEFLAYTMKRNSPPGLRILYTLWNGDNTNYIVLFIVKSDKTTIANSTFSQGGVSYSAENFVVAESFVLCINICDAKPAHRKSANVSSPTPIKPE